MNLAKAIEILDLNVSYPGAKIPPDVKDALQLGIEALKEIEEARLMSNKLPHTLLPGETKD